MATWIYDDLGWWANVVHTCAGPHGNPGNPQCAVTGDLVDSMCISTYYKRTLRYLAESDLEVNEAARLLFLGKSLQKWKIVDASCARERANKAYEGFIVRNGSPALQTPLPGDLAWVMKGLLARWLPRPNTDQLLDVANQGRFGPGAVAERLTHRERFACLSKWCSCDVHWPEVPPMSADADHDTVRLSAVPKTTEKDRLITVEPCYASYVQQMARSYILSAIHAGPLRGTCMDLGFTDGQLIQRRLALKASRKKTLATVDLSDASDGIGWIHVQQVFPPHILDWLWQARSTFFSCSQLGIAHARLHMYAGMGNATTFAVETLFFAAAVRALALIEGLPTFVSVFGDDIICHSSVAVEMAKRNYSFLKVNSTKTFVWSDALRESCGIFAYNGEDITIPKIDGYPNTWGGRLSLCDLHRRALNSRFSFVRRVAYAIAQPCVLPNYPFVLEGYPSLCNELVGLEYGWSVLPPSRWNSRLQRREYQVAVQLQKYKHVRCCDMPRSGKYKRPSYNGRWLLPANLAGLVGAGDAKVRKASRLPVGCSTVRFAMSGASLRASRWISPAPGDRKSVV